MTSPGEMLIETPHGPARAFVHPVADPIGGLVLGHGAGGGVSARDIVAVAGAAQEASIAVALVEQPYRVAGRRSPAPAKQLDAAWTAVLADLRAGPLAGWRSSRADGRPVRGSRAAPRPRRAPPACCAWRSRSCPRGGARRRSRRRPASASSKASRCPCS